MSVDLDGVFYTTQLVLKNMMSNGNGDSGGRIINISSIVGQTGNFGQVNYAAAKGAVISFTESLARELARKGITVNAVAPGFIDTEMTRVTARRQGIDPDQRIAEASKLIPVRRVGQPRDVANVICFLCSDEAGFVSGQIIYVAGGPRG